MPITIDSRLIKDAHLEIGTEGEHFNLLHDGVTLQFTKSFDGITYGPIITVADISSVSPKSFHVLQKNAADSSDLLLTNGVNFLMESDNYGDDWGPLP